MLFSEFGCTTVRGQLKKKKKIGIQFDHAKICDIIIPIVIPSALPELSYPKTA